MSGLRKGVKLSRLINWFKFQSAFCPRSIYKTAKNDLKRQIYEACSDTLNDELAILTMVRSFLMSNAIPAQLERCSKYTHFNKPLTWFRLQPIWKKFIEVIEQDEWLEKDQICR